MTEVLKRQLVRLELCLEGLHGTRRLVLCYALYWALILPLCFPSLVSKGNNDGAPARGVSQIHWDGASNCSRHPRLKSADSACTQLNLYR